MSRVSGVRACYATVHQLRVSCAKAPWADGTCVLCVTAYAYNDLDLAEQGSAANLSARDAGVRGEGEKR